MDSNKNEITIPQNTQKFKMTTQEQMSQRNFGPRNWPIWLCWA